MPTLNEYLLLDEPAARAQWEGVFHRQVPPPGTRQERFTPVETILCLGASLIVNHRQFGGATSHLAPEPVPQLARLFRRPPSSILAKMANLDGSRKNGARHEIEVAARLLNNLPHLMAVYCVAYSALRDVSNGAEIVPDFLGLFGDSGGDLSLLGQEELSDSEIEAAIEEEASMWARNRSDLEDRITERLLTAVARVGQHRFASQVLANHQSRCVFCGLTFNNTGARPLRMLVASHIKPWRHCTSAERIDPANGLTACPSHDVAFDTGLISINGDLRIHISDSIAHLASQDGAAAAIFAQPPLATRLLLPQTALLPGHRYLEWHRANVYRE